MNSVSKNMLELPVSKGLLNNCDDFLGLIKDIAYEIENEKTP